MIWDRESESDKRLWTIRELIVQSARSHSLNSFIRVSFIAGASWPPDTFLWGKKHSKTAVLLSRSELKDKERHKIIKVHQTGLNWTSRPTQMAHMCWSTRVEDMRNLDKSMHELSLSLSHTLTHTHKYLYTDVSDSELYTSCPIKQLKQHYSAHPELIPKYHWPLI